MQPRIEKLLSLIPNGRIQSGSPKRSHEIETCFEHSAEFPATAKLKFALGTDSGLDSMIISRDVEILPMYP